MNTFHRLSLAISLSVILFCAAQDGPIELEPPEIPPIKNSIDIQPIGLPTIKPILIWPSICLLKPMPQGCNPCRFGQPLTGVICGRGEQNCTALGGTCKVNQYDRAYCCPREHPGCCPSIGSPIIILPDPNLCRPTCATDAQCPRHQKCCGSCRRCLNATLTRTFLTA